MCGILEDDYKTTTLHITKYITYYKIRISWWAIEDSNL